LNFSSVAFIILLSKGPHAIVLLVMPRLPKWLARTLLIWCRPALDAEYANVSSAGTRRPSMLPMLMMRAGDEAVDAALSNGVTACVSWKTRLRLRLRTRSHAAEGYVSYEEPQLLPLLLTRTSSSATC
jgi:hypothetical protein